jgi:TrmH RNA methyltransferase
VCAGLYTASKLLGLALHDLEERGRPQSAEPDGEPTVELRCEQLRLLFLDGIGNPHNLGAIARTAAFFGLTRLAITDNPAQAAPSEAAYRVSEGGLVWLDIYRMHRLPDMLRRLSPFYTVVGTALGTGAPMPMQKLATGSKPVCLVLGNEEEGMSAAALAVCEHVATLPGAGPIQSLNVAATAAILIHAITGGFRTR